MNKHRGNRSGVRPPSDSNDAKTQTPGQLIQEELANLRARTEAAANSAHALTDLFLAHKTSLVSDISIVRDTAALLQHSVRNFEHVLATNAKRKSSQKNGTTKEAHS